VIEYEFNHLRADIDGLLKHVDKARDTTDPTIRDDALFRAGLRLMRVQTELERMGDVITQLGERDLTAS
jgi:hypothetical protein